MDLARKLGGEILAEEKEYIAKPLLENERMGRMLKGLRLRADMTQKGLAKEINIP